MTVKPHKLKTKKSKIIFFIIIFLIAGWIIADHYYVYYSSHISTDDAFIQGHAIPLSSRVSGHVLKVYVDDNKTVKKGDILVEIDPRDYQVRYAMAEANVEAAEAKAAQANEDVKRYKKLILN